MYFPKRTARLFCLVLTLLNTGTGKYVGLGAWVLQTWYHEVGRVSSLGERAGREEDEGGEASQKSYLSERWKHDVNSAEMRAGKGSRVSLRL